MSDQHHYTVTIKWTGNKGTGTSDYKSYEREHSILVDHKMEILGSSDPEFRGDKTKHNPEELLVASLSACHMLMYLHLCADAGVVVVEYLDHARGIMVQTADGRGRITEVTLTPIITVKDSEMLRAANVLHKKANKLCFIANSVNFPVYHQPISKTEVPRK